MNWPVIVLIFSQLLFATSDLMGRYYMVRYGFTAAAFVSIWFWVYMGIRTIATVGQLYVFSELELGRTITMFAATAIIIANATGFLVLGEVLSPLGYVGVVLAVIAFIILAIA